MLPRGCPTDAWSRSKWKEWFPHGRRKYQQNSQRYGGRSKVLKWTRKTLGSEERSRRDKGEPSEESTFTWLRKTVTTPMLFFLDVALTVQFEPPVLIPASNTI